MKVKDLKDLLGTFDPNFEVYAINYKGEYRRVEAIHKDDWYPDLMIVAGDVE